MARPAVVFTKTPRPASSFLHAALGLNGKHKKKTVDQGAYSGDPEYIGAGLCRILHPNFRLV
jgi:hypothetical protein